MRDPRGRPKGDHMGARVNVYFENEEVLHRIDRLARKGGMSRSRLIANIVDEGVKSLEAAEMVGILDFALLIRRFSEGLQTWAGQMREERRQINVGEVAA